MNFVISGNYGAENLGDELILEGLIKFLKENFLVTSITVLSANPKQTSKRHQIKAVHQIPAGFRTFPRFFSSEYKKTKSAIQSADHFILCGGGLFAGPEKSANLIWAIQALFAQKYCSSFLILGQSIGPLNSFFIRTIVKIVFSKAKIIAMRDQESINILNGVLTQKSELAPDFAFYISHLSPEKPRKKEISIALRSMPSINQNFIEGIGKFLNEAAKKENWTLNFIDFKQAQYQDQQLHQEVIKKLDPKILHNHYKNINTSTELFEIIGRSSLMIGMRLHSIISAIKTNTPFLAINYAPKVKNLVSDLKLEQYLISSDINEKILNSKLEELKKNHQKVEEFLKKQNKKNPTEFERLQIKLQSIFNS